MATERAIRQAQKVLLDRYLDRTPAQREARRVLIRHRLAWDLRLRRYTGAYLPVPPHFTKHVPS